ncbi:peptidoglycan-binding protein [Microcoleus sp. FACHB-SPT15]|uniref:peptidoglycan-binding domain-containing protein n=1 Tax=Microcoleus sp. FACHB-SPT15 TaxID=2692830 RepID=UPI0017858B88|nr:peptidoglycan-binding domain-containing protein [Microcoleus sp. FACHB-SPT15]MBD1808128.1 peptidoglycan-binding protein [Microcoleus sp. FACHB-SPT15]
MRNRFSELPKSSKDFRRKQSLPVNYFKLSAKFASQITKHLLLLVYGLSISISANSVPLLQFGDRGSEVLVLQNNLQSQGFYSGPVDGFYGDLTKSAIENFQQQNGLAVDGIAGDNTQLRLQNRLPLSSSTTLAQASGTIFGDITIGELAIGFITLGFIFAVVVPGVRNTSKSTSSSENSKIIEGVHVSIIINKGVRVPIESFDLGTQLKIQIINSEGKVVKSFDDILNENYSKSIDSLPTGKYKVVATGKQNGKKTTKEINVTFD